MTATDPGAEIRAVIHTITSAWLDGPPEQIVDRVLPCFDANAVTYGLAPNLQPVARGAAVCAKSYEDFVRMATVREFSAGDPDIHVVGETATAVCPWSMTYTLNDATYTESGHEILVFHREGGQWRVTWRLMLPAAS